MIKTLCLDSQARRFVENFPASALSDFAVQPHNVVWADVSDPTGRDFAQLAEEFGFHPLSIEDCRGGHQRPKIEEYPGYYFIVVYEAELAGPNDALELRELNIFLGPNFLVTVHSRPIRAVERAKRLWPGWLDRTEHQGAGLLAYLLADAVVDDYMPLLDLLSERTDELVDEIFADLRPELLQEIFLIKRQLVYLRRVIGPLREVFNVILRREQPMVSRENQAYFQDVFYNVLRVGDMLDALRETLGTAMEAYLSISGNRLNTAMKRLTSISTILMSATLVAGIYGMNFEAMPELKWRFGYVYALLAMVGISWGIYLYLKRIRWL